MLDRATRSLVTTGVLAFVTAALGAQQPPQQTTDQKDAQQPPRFRVESNFVRIDAYPLRDGKPVMDLKGEDFQVFEDGAAQKIETFEHVVVRPAGPQSERTDVSSQRESLQAAANPRNRVFIIFLDTPHVMVDSAHNINEPLIRLLDRIIGPDDLVGVMTPAMAANQIVLGRKTQVIEDSLRQNWPWGTRFSLLRDEHRSVIRDLLWDDWWRWPTVRIVERADRAQAGAGDARFPRRISCATCGRFGRSARPSLQ